MINLLSTIRPAQSILKCKFPSVDKPLRITAPPKISPSKRAFEKYKPRGLFSEFYGNIIGFDAVTTTSHLSAATSFPEEKFFFLQQFCFGNQIALQVHFIKDKHSFP